MNISGVITGIILTGLGMTFLVFAGDSSPMEKSISLIFFGVSLVGIGIYMLFHLKDEDFIEKRKDKIKIKRKVSKK